MKESFAPRASGFRSFLAVFYLLLCVAFAYLACETFAGDEVFPQACSDRGRGSQFCEWENWLYERGGQKAAALPNAVVSGIFLALFFVMKRR